MIGRKVCDGRKPARNFGAGIPLRAKFLEARGSIQMQYRKRPDVARFALTVAITLSRTHSSVASKVVRDKAMGLQPVRDPRRLVAIRGRIFSNGFAGYLLQGILVEREELLEVFWIVGFHMGRKIVVNPATVASDFITEASVFADQILADGIVLGVKALFVAHFARIGPGRDVNRVWSLLQQGPRTHLLQRLDCGI